MAITQPEIEFSPWILWSPDAVPKTHVQCPSSDEKLQFPGIYVWALSHETPSKMSIELPPKEIVYIGEAKKSLKNRIQQFARSCFAGSLSHKGGSRCGLARAESDLSVYLAFYSVIVTNENGNRVERDVWEGPDHWVRPFLHYVERKIIWNYTRHWGHRPDSNKT